MIVANEKDVPAMVMESPEVKAAAIKALISPQQGWEGYVMRVKSTPLWQHFLPPGSALPSRERLFHGQRS